MPLQLSKLVSPVVLCLHALLWLVNLPALTVRLWSPHCAKPVMLSLQCMQRAIGGCGRLDQCRLSVWMLQLSRTAVRTSQCCRLLLHLCLPHSSCRAYIWVHQPGGELSNTCCSHVALLRLVSDSSLAMASSFAAVDTVATCCSKTTPTWAQSKVT